MEFNHDLAMELASGRSPRLIDRVLGDEGHLSNTQGAALVRAVLGRSEIGRVRHLVQLHLSRQCNRPYLAREAANAILDDFTFRVEVHTARQDEPGVTLHLGASTRRQAAAPYAVHTGDAPTHGRTAGAAGIGRRAGDWTK